MYLIIGINIAEFNLNSAFIYWNLAMFDTDICCFFLNNTSKVHKELSDRYPEIIQHICTSTFETARPDISYIVRFGPYRPYGFVLGIASLLLSLIPKNTYNMLATCTTNKTSYQTLTCRCGILHVARQCT